MNLASECGDSNSNLLFVNFNQDCTSLAAGTHKGYRLFSLNSVDKLENIHEVDTEDICIVERLFSSSLVALVSLSSPRKLKVCHFKKGTEICNYSYSNTILAVKLNRMRLIVCLEESLYIHSIRDMKVQHTIRETPANRAGLCALSTNNENCYLAYPGSAINGEVQIFDAAYLRAVTMIPAHDSPLAALTFDSLGTKLATASEKGTVIRVFSVPSGQKIYEFRRGMRRCARIFSMAFSSDSVFLACSSNTESIHVFKLEDKEGCENLRLYRIQDIVKPFLNYICDSKNSPAQTESKSSEGWIGYLGSALASGTAYLPSGVTEIFSQGRDHALARIPSLAGLRSVVALATIQKLPRLLVAGQDGYLYIFNVDPIDGGQCSLLKHHKMDALTKEHCPPSTPTPTPNQPIDITRNNGQSPESLAYDEHSEARASIRLDDDKEFPPMGSSQ